MNYSMKNFYLKNKTNINFSLFIFILVFFPVLIYRKYLISAGHETSNTLNDEDQTDTLDKEHRMYDDIIYTIPSIFMLFMLGNYKNTFSPISVIFVVVFTVLYNYLVNLPTMNMDLSFILSSDRPSAIKTRYSILILSIIGCISHLYLGYKENILLFYIPIFLIVVFICFGLPFVIAKKDNTVRDAHLHHSYIVYILAFFTRFDHPISKLFANALLGAYVQGLSAYGRLENTFNERKY